MKQAVTILLFSILILACKKKEEESCSTCLVGGSAEPPGFVYTKDGGADIRTTASSYYPANKTIVASYQNSTYRVIIKTTSQAVGVYTFTSTANTLTYFEPLGNYVATSGTVTINSNTGGKLSGSFVSNGGGVASTIRGQFKGLTAE